VTHDVSLTYSRFEHMPPSAVALAVLLHVGVGLALFWISPLRPIDHFEDAIEISMDAPTAMTPVAEQKTEPTPEPAAAPAPPPPAPAASAPTPRPQPAAPPMRLGLPPPPAERSTNPADVAGAETPAPRATDMPTPDTVQEAGPKEESKPEEPKPQEARQEPPPQQQALAQPEPPAPQQPAVAQPEPPPPQQPALVQPEPPPAPQQQAVAKPEPPPPPPPPSLEQALPPLDAPPPPVTERDIPKPPPVPRAAPPLSPPAPPQQQQAARPAPPPPAPAPAQRPPPPAAPPQQQLRPSPLAPQAPGGSGARAAAQPSPAFRNPADEYGQKRAQEQYLWQVMRRIAQFPYVPKNSGVIREEGTVLTRVTISRQGELLGAVMEKSSGLPSLDAGVMDTIRRASPYPPLPADIPGDRHTFQLPVSFRYNEQR
jgi:protein TonB